MKKRKFSKVIAVALAALMVVGMVPMMAFADDDDEAFSGFKTVDAAADESYTAETLNERDSISNVVYAQGMTNTYQGTTVTNLDIGTEMGTTVFIYDGENEMKVPVSFSQKGVGYGFTTSNRRTRWWVPTTEDFSMDGNFWYGYSTTTTPAYYAGEPNTTDGAALAEDYSNNSNGVVYATLDWYVDGDENHTNFAAADHRNASSGEYMNYSGTLVYSGELADNEAYRTISSTDWNGQSNSSDADIELTYKYPVYVINVKPLYDAIVEAEAITDKDDALTEALAAAEGIDLTTYSYAEDAEKAVKDATADVAAALKTLSLAVTPCEHENAKKVGAKEATCGAEGNYAYVYCEDCDTYWMYSDEADEDVNNGYVMVTADNVAIQATGEHRWNESKTTDYIAPACEEDGAYATMTCKDCGNTYYYKDEEYNKDTTELYLVEDDNYVISNLGGHEYGSAVVKMAPTCTERGYQEYTCTVCGYVLGEEMKATGHSYDSGKVITAATCDDAGEMLYTCTVCGATNTETIKALGHSYDYDADTTYFTWSEDHSACTITAVCANDASHTETQDCTVEIVKTPATWEEDGSIVYTATYNSGSILRPNNHTDEYVEILPMFGDNASALDGGLVKVVEDENITIKSNTPEYETFDIVASVAGLLDVEFNDVVAEDDVDISFNYTGLNEDGTISVAEDATEVSFGIEDFSCVYAASATITSDEIYEKVNEIIAMFAEGQTLDELISAELGSLGSFVVGLVKAILSPVEITPEFVVVTPQYVVTATDAEGNVYYFDVAYEEDDAGYTGNATFTCANIPAGDYTVSVDYTYGIAFTYDVLYTELNDLLDLLAGYMDLSTVLGDYADMVVGNLEIPISGTANIRSISSSDEFGLALEKTIGSEDIIIEVEEREDGLTKTRTGADVSFVGGADEAGTFDVNVNVLGMSIDFTDVVAADDLNISFNYSGLNESGTLTVGEDATVASFGVDNFTYDYSALASISSTAIVDVVVDLLGTFGVDMSDYASILYGAVPAVDLTSDSAALTATYTVYATAADGTVYPFTVVYDGNNATFTCYNIPAGEYDVTVEYAFDISFDYDTLYTGITDLLANPLVSRIIDGLGDEIAGMLDALDLDIQVSGTAESVRVIESSDIIPTTVLADIENEDVPSAGGEGGSGESGESGSGESGETSETCEHEFYIVDSAEATCEDEGWVLYACSICGEQFVQYTAALGHDFVDGVCTVCGALDPDYVADDTSTAAAASSSTTAAASDDDDDDEFTEADEEEDEFTEVEEDEFEVVEDEDLTSPATGASMAAIGAAMAFAAAGIVVVTRKKKEDEE